MSFESSQARLSEPDAEPEVSEAPEVLAAHPVETNAARARVLVVDDREDNRFPIEAFLRPLGIEVIEAENGKEAIEKWEQTQPQLVLMDLRMPVMDGYTAAAQIRARQNRRRADI